MEIIMSRSIRTCLYTLAYTYSKAGFTNHTRLIDRYVRRGYNRRVVEGVVQEAVNDQMMDCCARLPVAGVDLPERAFSVRIDEHPLYKKEH